MKMIKTKNIIVKSIITNTLLIILFLSFTWVCTNDNPILQPVQSVEGTWSEDFYWSSFGHIIIGGGTLEDSVMIKTSTLTFSENSFELKILPPHRIFSSIGDSVFVTNNSDTVFTGSYTISADTLKFIMGPDQIAKPFKYRINGDSLYISQLPISVDTSGTALYEMSSFLWGNTFSKHSGVFGRKQ